MKLPNCLFCPPKDDEVDECSDDESASQGGDGDTNSVSKRHHSEIPGYHRLEKRLEYKPLDICGDIRVTSPGFDYSSNIMKNDKNVVTYGYHNPNDCDDYDFGTISTPSDTKNYATEHILEFQLLKIFLDGKNTKDGKKYRNSKGVLVTLCDLMREFWAGDTTVNVGGGENTPMKLLPGAFPGKNNAYASEFVVLYKPVNRLKEGVSTISLDVFDHDDQLTQEQMWAGHQIVSSKDMVKSINNNAGTALGKMRNVISAWKYHQDQTIKTNLKTQSDRVGRLLDALDGAIAKKDKTYQPVVNLGSDWNAFMRARSSMIQTKMETFFTDNLKLMSDAWKDTSVSSSNGKPKAPPDPKSKTARLEKLKQERQSLGAWSNPF